MATATKKSPTGALFRKIKQPRKNRSLFDIATVAGRNALEEYLNNDPDARDVDYSDIDGFAKNGDMPAIRAGEVLIFNEYAVIGGIIVKSDNLPFPRFGGNATSIREYLSTIRQRTARPLGVVIPHQIALGKAMAFTIIRCGDELNDSLVSELRNEWPTLSFECVSRFFHCDASKIFQMFADGILELVDYTPDHRIELTAAEKDTASVHKITDSRLLSLSPKPPTGYSLVGSRWHRSATCVIKDTRRGGKSYLFGQDEGTYFGCELKDNPKTVKAAYDSLTPDAVKGKRYQRQGEWFVVAVAAKNVPKSADCVLMFGPAPTDDDIWRPEALSGDVALPIDVEGSNYHWIRDTQEGRVGRDGTIYALTGSLKHSSNEHRDLHWTGWASFHRNTALRSFSVEGVD